MVGSGFIADKGKVKIHYDTDLFNDDGCGGSDLFNCKDIYEVSIGVSDDRNEIYADIDPAADNGYDVYYNRSEKRFYALNSDDRWVALQKESSLMDKLEVKESGFILYSDDVPLNVISKCFIDQFSETQDMLRNACQTMCHTVRRFNENIYCGDICDFVTGITYGSMHHVRVFFGSFFLAYPPPVPPAPYEDPLPWLPM